MSLVLWYAVDEEKKKKKTSCLFLHLGIEHSFCAGIEETFEQRNRMHYQYTDGEGWNWEVFHPYYMVLVS